MRVGMVAEGQQVRVRRDHRESLTSSIGVLVLGHRARHEDRRVNPVVDEPVDDRQGSPTRPPMSNVSARSSVAREPCWISVLADGGCGVCVGRAVVVGVARGVGRGVGRNVARGVGATVGVAVAISVG